MADSFNAYQVGISYTEYPEYNQGALTGAISDAASSGVNYPNGNPFQLKASESSVPSSQTITEKVWLTDIAQSHHFTVQLNELFTKTVAKDRMRQYQCPGGAFSDFLPVKSIQLNYTSYENMSIPFAIFGDFPLLNKKRVSTISITCYDEDTNQIEYALNVWEDQCFPQGKFAAYLNEVSRELVYRGYNVLGEETLKIRKIVIPTGNVSVSRDYSENGAKLITFSLMCIGDGSTCQVGTPGNKTQREKVNNQAKGDKGKSTIDLTQGGKVKAATGYSGAGAPPNDPMMFVNGSFINDAKRIGKKIINKGKKITGKMYPHFDENGNKK